MFFLGGERCEIVSGHFLMTDDGAIYPVQYLIFLLDYATSSV